jgi:phage host-nuclease inhibitor protein Gam
MAKAKSARVKTAALAVVAPTTAEQADAMVRRVGELMRAKIVIQAALDEGMSTLRTEAAAEAAPITTEIANLTAAVQAWAEANRDELTRGGRVKTHRLPSGEIAWRHLPPSVRISSPETVLKLLQQMGLSQFLREKVEIDRDALKAQPEAARAVPGVTIGSAGEEFIVTPATTELAA